MLRDGLEPGSVFKDRWRVEAVLGRGGMGTVYRATDLHDGRVVALKLAAREHFQDESFLARFRREARAAATIDHPLVVKVVEWGVEPDAAWLVLELLPGGSLATVLHDRGRFPPGEVARLGAAIARALAVVHDAGYIHRDLKPANVLLDPGGNPKLSDFGLVRNAPGLPALSGALTRSGEIVGTLEYLAPEQADGREVDARADLYALGALLYALLTGAPPFSGQGATLIYKHLTAPVPSLRAQAGDVPAELEELVLQLLAKQPSDRPASAGEVARRLEELEARIGVRPRGGRAALLLVPLAALVVLASLVAVLLARSGPSAPPAPTPGPPPDPVPSLPPAKTSKGLLVAGPIWGDRAWKHPAVVRTVATSADGKTVFAGDELGNLWAWDAAEGRRSRVFPPSKLPIAAVAVVGDRLISAGGDGELRVFSTETGERLASVTSGPAGQDRGGFLCLAVSPDRKTIFTGDNWGGFRVFELDGLKLVASGVVPDHAITALEVSPRGEKVLLGTNQAWIKEWNVLDRDWGRAKLLEPVRRKIGEGREVLIDQVVTRIRFLDDTHALVTTWADKVVLCELPAQRSQGLGVLVAPDVGGPGQIQLLEGEKALIAAVDRHGGVRASYEKLLEFRTQPIPLPGHAHGVRDFVRRGNILVTGSADGSVGLWDMSSGQDLRKVSGHRSEITSIRVAGRRVFSTGHDGALVEWDAKRRAPTMVWRGEAALSQAWLLADGKRFVVAEPIRAGECLALVDPSAPPGTRLGRLAATRAVAVLSNDLHISYSAGMGGLIRYVNGIPTGAPFLRETSAESTLLVSPEGGRLLAFGSSAWIYDLQRDVEVGTPASAKLDGITCASFHEQSRLVIGYHNGDVKLWDLRDRPSTPPSFPSRASYVAAVAIVDGMVVVGTLDGYVRLHELTTGKLLDEVEVGDDDHATAMTVGPDAHTVLVATARGVVVPYTVRGPR